MHDALLVLLTLCGVCVGFALGTLADTLVACVKAKLRVTEIITPNDDAPEIITTEMEREAEYNARTRFVRRPRG